MISIEPTQSTNKVLDDLSSGHFFNKNILGKVDMIEIAVVAKETIKARLVEVLGEAKAKHFDVTLAGTNQYGINIHLNGDQVAMVLVHGAGPHEETGSGGPMAFEDSGVMVFTKHISHPGFHGIEDQVNTIVREGFMLAYEAVAKR